ncbi:MAG: class I SAM-dependent methyltransferase [Cyanobacteria bacterium P01_D01_bin.123]
MADRVSNAIHATPVASAATITERVRQLYDTYPFPPEPLLDGDPLGFNWRWSWPQAYSFCTNRYPTSNATRILDAGCGSGAGTEYLVHQNPEAEIWAFDLSEKALAIAAERCAKFETDRLHFRHLSIDDIETIPGQFDFINCVGVLHHLPDPQAGLNAIASKLVPGGLAHIFVYGELGRWEIQLMQRALRLLVNGDENQSLASVDRLKEGLTVGRQLFETLPDDNRIVVQDKARWSMENGKDECFADMYLHPCEADYNCNTLFDWIDRAGLEFVGFSNPKFWQLDRLLASAPDLMELAGQLTDRQRYRAIELLDPTPAHYEFFLTKSPLERFTWTDEMRLDAIAHRSPCIWLWPGPSVMNYDCQPVALSPSAQQFLTLANGEKSVRDIQAELDAPLTFEQLRALQQVQLLLLADRS